jgi:hypothetical protein
MFKLDLRGSLLYLHGTSQTLEHAEAHNNRQIPIELYARDKIDPSRIYLNQQLVPLSKTLKTTVLDMITSAGINTSKGTFKRLDKGFAIEWIFSVTPGFECDFKYLYLSCLDWLIKRYPSCPVAHAVIHFDEDVPHMHVIMVPIVGKHLPASKVLGFKGCSKERSYDLFEKVGMEFGLSYSMYLKGAAKKAASDKAIQELEKLGYREKLSKLWPPFQSAVRSRPEPFLDVLGILHNAHHY